MAVTHKKPHARKVRIGIDSARGITWMAACEQWVVPLKTSFFWKDVTCDECLKHRPKGKR